MVEWERKTIQFSKGLVRLAEEEQERLGLNNFSEVARYIFAEHLGGEFISSQTEARKGAGRTPKYDHVKIRDKIYRFMQGHYTYTYVELAKGLGLSRALIRRIIHNNPKYFQVIRHQNQVYIRKVILRDREKLLREEE